jgi:hypothetical protein
MVLKSCDLVGFIVNLLLFKKNCCECRDITVIFCERHLISIYLLIVLLLDAIGDGYLVIKNTVRQNELIFHILLLGDMKYYKYIIRLDYKSYKSYQSL